MAFSAPLWLDAHLVTMCDRSGGANDGLPEASSIRPGLAGLPESRGTKTEMPIDFFAPCTSIWVNQLLRLPPPAAPDSSGKFFLLLLLFVIFKFYLLHEHTKSLRHPHRPRTERTLTGYTSRAETYLSPLHPPSSYQSLLPPDQDETN